MTYVLAALAGAASVIGLLFIPVDPPKGAEPDDWWPEH